jgi:hypothetical protein
MLIAVAACGFLSPVATAQEDFSVKEYNVFHELLHPLEHEAVVICG